MAGGHMEDLEKLQNCQNNTTVEVADSTTQQKVTYTGSQMH